MNLIKTFYLCCVLLLISNVGYSQTGLIEDFNDGTPTGWIGGKYKITEQNGELLIAGGKPDIWDGFDFQFAALNLSSSADKVVSFKVKSNSDFNISCSLGDNVKIDAYGKNSAQVVIGNVGYQTLSFDFSDATGVDWTKVVNLHFVFNQLSVYPGGGINGNQAAVYLDDLQIGSTATLTPRLNALPDQYFTVTASGTNARTIPLHNVTDGTSGTNAITVTAVSSNTAIVPNPVVTYASPNKSGTLRITPNNNVSGEAIITVTVKAAGTKADKIITFKAIVVANGAPNLEVINNINLQKGVEARIPLKGISDGDASAIQDITITSSSSATSIVPNPTVVYTNGSSIGELVFTPSASATPGSKATVTVTVSDNGGTGSSGVNQLIRTFDVTVYNDVNNLPTIDLVKTVGLPAIVGANSILLTGLSDGDAGTQTLTITGGTSNGSVITNITGGPVVNGSAQLNFNLTGVIDTAVITVNVTDNGGNAGNNGNQTTQIKFTLKTLLVPTYSYATDFPDTDAPFWSPEDGIPTVEVTGGNLHIKTDIKPSTYPGLFFSIKSAFAGKEIDISKNPFLSMRIKFSSKNTNKPGKLTVALVDQYGPGGCDGITSNGYTTTMIENFIPCDDQYHDIVIDYRGLFKPTKEGCSIDSTRINALLFNFDCTWFQAHTGEYWIDNMKLGDAAENKPTDKPVVTIDPVAAVSLYKKSTPKPIVLTGISDGAGNKKADLTFVNSNNNLIKNIAISTPLNGTANLTYTLGTTANTLDSSKITIYADNLANAKAIRDTMEFMIYVVDSIASKSTVTVNLTQEYQTIVGMGGVVPVGKEPSLISDVNDLNYSLMRIFTNADWEDVNDNSDPNVMAFENFKFNMTLMDNIRLINQNTNCQKFWWCSLTPPYWQKGNKAIHPFLAAQGYCADNVLLPEMEDEYAETVLAAFKGVKEYAGVDLYGFSLQNEPEFNEPYGSAKVFAPQFVSLFKNIGPKLVANGIPARRLMASDDIFSVMSWVTDRINAIKNDAEASKYLRTVNVHAYSPDGINVSEIGSAGWITLKDLTASTAAEGLWQTETSGYADEWEGKAIKDYMNGNWTYSPGPLVYAANIFSAFKAGHITGWIDLYSPTSLNREMHTSGVFKQYSKYAVVPGAKMVEATSNDNNILSLAFKNPANNSTSIILINRKHSPQLVTIAGTNVPKSYKVYSTYKNASFIELESVGDGVVLLPPRSVTTLVNSPSNSAPTINVVANQTMIVADGAKTINLAGVSDGDPDKNQVVTLTASSSNTDACTVTSSYTNGQSTGSITITPKAAGSSTISITVKDDGGVAGGGMDTKVITFTVNVSAANNNVPAFNLPADPTILEDIAQQITISGIDDGDASEIQNITFTVTSSNQAVFTDASLVVTYTKGAATATFDLAPVKNANGSAVLTIRAVDDGGTAFNNGNQTTIKTMNVTVTAVNDKPTMAQPVDRFYSDIVAKDYTISLSSVDDGDADLTQTVTVTALSKTTSIVTTAILSGNRIKLSLTGEAGTSEIVVTLTDNGGTANGGKDTAVYKFVVSNSTNSLSESLSEKLDVYPNPSKDFIFIKNLNSQSVTKVELVDLKGNIQIAKNFDFLSGEAALNLENLSSGLYLLRVYCGDEYGVKTIMIE